MHVQWIAYNVWCIVLLESPLMPSISNQMTFHLHFTAHGIAFVLLLRLVWMFDCLIFFSNLDFWCEVCSCILFYVTFSNQVGGQSVSCVRVIQWRGSEWTSNQTLHIIISWMLSDWFKHTLYWSTGFSWNLRPGTGPIMCSLWAGGGKAIKADFLWRFQRPESWSGPVVIVFWESPLHEIWLNQQPRICYRVTSLQSPRDGKR